MPNYQIRVGMIAHIDPPPADERDEALRSRFADGISITLDDENPLRLSLGKNPPEILGILRELQNMGRPVYLEIDEETQTLIRLLIPQIFRVGHIHPEEAGEIQVDFEISHARYVLRRDHPDFEQLLGRLREAQQRDEWLIVTGTDLGEIIHIKPFPFPIAPPRLKRWPPWLHWWWKWWWWLRRFFFCWTSTRRAGQLFQLVANQTCDPLTVPVPCIPFLYPEDGCWGRAHEMYRLMIAAGARPKKVWIYGNLTALTRNSPNCQVRWGWHVAPTLCVRVKWYRVVSRVIDPSLFSQPVSKTTWKSVQGDPGATLVDSSGSVFYRSSGGSVIYDPTYSQTDSVLATYRLDLRNRAINSGPPPYAQCPL